MQNVNYDLVKYVIPCYKLNKNEKIDVLLVSDIHDYTKNKMKSNMLASKIKNLMPHHIVIAGDNLEGNQWEDYNTIKWFRDFLENISECAPVFISLGNHDVNTNNTSNEKKRLYNFQKLYEVRSGMIYPLLNDKVVYDNFDIYSSTLYVNVDDNVNSNLLHKSFVDKIDKNIQISNSNNIVEFIGHNPSLIIGNDKMDLKSLKNVDTFYTGHRHNGYVTYKRVLKKPDKYLDVGYTEKAFEKELCESIVLKNFNPFIMCKTDLCRGTIYLNNYGEKLFLELRNNHFYRWINNKWYPVFQKEAYEEILKNNLKALVISGGIKKFSYFSDLLDKPEITIVSYQKKKVLIR